jgi:hypothetical protein
MFCSAYGLVQVFVGITLSEFAVGLSHGHHNFFLRRRVCAVFG